MWGTRKREAEGVVRFAVLPGQKMFDQSQESASQDLSFLRRKRIVAQQK
jgi:hypothetical protein